MQAETLNSQDSIKKLLKAIGFSPTDGKNGEWEKLYHQNQHRIAVVLGKSDADSHVNYGQVMTSNAGRKTTHNFSQPESLVVLECVDRLLNLGYEPGSIVLEKQYPVGHTHGWLDILIRQGDAPYLMVECKRWGQEFEKERAELFSNGGQLLSYCHQDRATKFITLYASHIQGDHVENKFCAVDTSILKGDSVSELFDTWDKSYFETGVFDSMPYQIKEKRLTKADLLDMTLEDGSKIFNAFAEILRRYVVSDKPNAFNKMFNLFICKVQDEEKQDDEILDFQWQAGETSESVLNRLNDLYKQGMKQYLKMEIADHTETEIQHILSAASDSNRSALYRIYTELRLYKNNEFAFKEVFDKKTFDANSEVVREVVRLLQKKRLRYTHKQQFLGDFFERLLNTSVKQEAGQFFTPIPIARFICDSLPLQAIIDKKLQDNEPNFLPYVIDYASGSGHFLTESMDRIDHMVKSIDASKLRTGLKSNLRKWSEDYAWADNFIYGIEKDYRLHPITKVFVQLVGFAGGAVCGTRARHKPT